MREEIRTPEEIADIINHYPFYSKGYNNRMGELKGYIQRDLTVGEIHIFGKFLRGEDFSRHDPEYHRDTSHYITLEWIKFDDLKKLFDQVSQICQFYLGAASALKINGAKLCGTLDFFAIARLYCYTLRELIRAVPEEYRKQLDAASKLDAILAANARLEAKADESGQGIAALVQHLPEAKKPSVIEWDEAVAIMKCKGGDPTWSARTGRNWLKAGKAAKTGTPISWDDLATTASWSAWVDAYLAALKSKLSKKSFISQRKAQAEAAENRRRGRIV